MSRRWTYVQRLDINDIKHSVIPPFEYLLFLCVHYFLVYKLLYMLEKPWVTVLWQEGGKMQFQPNVVILKGIAIDGSLSQTMVHIFSQWGSLVCEQGSGRAVNRPLYEAVRGGLRSSMVRIKPHMPCVQTQLWPVCFDGSERLAWLRPCVRWMRVKQESSHWMRNWPLGLHQSQRCIQSKPPESHLIHCFQIKVMTVWKSELCIWHLFVLAWLKETGLIVQSLSQKVTLRTASSYIFLDVCFFLIVTLNKWKC